MRSWLNDKRAYFVMKHWLKSSQCQKLTGYNHVENFRSWVAMTTNSFFNITGLWPDWAVAQCCVALRIECPRLESGILDSWSEDELICQKIQTSQTGTPIQPQSRQASRLIPRSTYKATSGAV